MAETLTWSFGAGSSSGAGLTSNGSLEVQSTTTASVALDPDMAAATDLALQLDDVDKVEFLAVVSSIDDGTVEVQADGANPTALTGPLILYGAAVKLFAGDLTTLKVQNKHATDAAELTVLIARQLEDDGS